MTDFWSIIGHIANVIGIILFPFTIYELFTIKSRIKKAQESMKEILNIKDYQTISVLLNNASIMQESLSQIFTNHNKKGCKIESLKNKCQELVDKINDCILSTPSQYEDLINSFNSCKKELQNYIELNQSQSLKDAGDYLFSCIKLLKNLSDQTINTEVDRIAKSK